MDGGTPIYTATVSRGMAVFTDSAFDPGSHTITAVYGGDATFTGAPQLRLPKSLPRFRLPFL